MNFNKFLLLSICCLFFGISVVSAQVDDGVNVNLDVGDIPPDTPTNITPADGAIDVSLTPTLTASTFSDPNGDMHQASQWQLTATSSDYTNPIFDSGTTTTDLTSVTVTPALVNETTYYWRVRYFDSSGLWSSYSTETSFTTEGVGGGPGGGGGGGGGSAPDEDDEDDEQDDEEPFTITLTSVSVDAERSRIRFETSVPATFVFSWGVTADYEVGTLATVSSAREHEAFLENLIPDTRYFFRIVAENSDGTQAALQGQFRTAGFPDVSAPQNPQNFQAELIDTTTVRLTWDNPPDPDFAFVRIVRSDLFFPLDPLDGFVVYEGDGEETTDVAPPAGTMFYYALFTYDEDGNHSSGVLDSVSYSEQGVPEEEPSGIVPSEAFTFSQNAAVIAPFPSGNIPIFAHMPTRVSLPTDMREDHIFIIGFEDGRSYLFEMDDDHFVVSVPPFGRSGFVPFTIVVYDRAGNIIDRIPGTFEVTLLTGPEERPHALFGALFYIWWVPFMLALLLTFLIYLRARHRDSGYVA